MHSRSIFRNLERSNIKPSFVPAQWHTMLEWNEGCLQAIVNFSCIWFLLGNSKLPETCEVKCNSLATAIYNQGSTLAKFVEVGKVPSQCSFDTAPSSRTHTCTHSLICAKNRIPLDRWQALVNKPNTLSTRFRLRRFFKVWQMCGCDRSSRSASSQAKHPIYTFSIATSF